MYILCYYMFGVYNLLFLFYRVVTIKRFPTESKKTLDFELLSTVETIKDYGTFGVRLSTLGIILWPKTYGTKE